MAKVRKHPSDASLHIPGNHGYETLHSLLDVGVALTSQRSIPKLLDIIIKKAIDVTQAESASLYLVEKIQQDSFAGLRPEFIEVLKYHKTLGIGGQVSIPDAHVFLDNKTIPGYVAMTGDSIRIRDVRTLPKNAPYAGPTDTEGRLSLRIKSMLAVPIRNSAGKTLGVLQLQNKLKTVGVEARKQNQELKERHISAFSETDDKLMRAFAGQAAVALENARLSKDIEDLLESFIKASITAIESRDPTTRGHSDRVANLSVNFAVAVDSCSTAPFAAIHFSREQIQEIRYAALLHDFGKIGVRENVLLKGKKLYPHELETILLRLDTLAKRNESNVWRLAAQKLGHSVEAADPASSQAIIGRATTEIDQFNRLIEAVRQQILRANEPQILSGDFDVEGLLMQTQSLEKELGQRILTPDESLRLSIPKGTLSHDERREIESHVSYTYQFLSQIAWTGNLSNVPEIAHCHHEKLDGSGYPRGLTAREIPLQSRMMTISDIYDALTAMDRPYKKAASSERALEILHFEANDGKLDRQLLRVFIESEIYKNAKSARMNVR